MTVKIERKPKDPVVAPVATAPLKAAARALRTPDVWRACQLGEHTACLGAHPETCKCDSPPPPCVCECHKPKEG